MTEKGRKISMPMRKDSLAFFILTKTIFCGIILVIGEKIMFKLHSKFEPTGDQPEAIKSLVNGINKGDKFQTLLGVTGSGKTFTMANKPMGTDSLAFLYKI